jgi:hypothetical protein
VSSSRFLGEFDTASRSSGSSRSVGRTRIKWFWWTQSRDRAIPNSSASDLGRAAISFNDQEVAALEAQALKFISKHSSIRRTSSRSKPRAVTFATRRNGQALAAGRRLGRFWMPPWTSAISVSRYVRTWVRSMLESRTRRAPCPREQRASPGIRRECDGCYASCQRHHHADSNGGKPAPIGRQSSGHGTSMGTEIMSAPGSVIKHLAVAWYSYDRNSARVHK